MKTAPPASSPTVLPAGTSAHAGACCVTLERRRSDFERDARVTPFTGSCCCCCCCLHWIGAVAGGAIGMRLGWKKGEEVAGPLTDEAHAAMKKGLWIGIAAAAVLLGVGAALAASGLDAVGGPLLLVFAIVPCLVFVPIGLPVVLATYRLRRRKLAEFLRDMSKLPAKDGADVGASLYRAKLTVPPKTRDPVAGFSVFCPSCWTDLQESLHLSACPECNASIAQPAISGPDHGVRVAWRAALTSLGLSAVGTAAMYLFMLLIAWVLG